MCALGALGFVALDLPLPWLLGSLAATIIGSLAGVPVAVPSPVRQYLIIAMGMMLGSTFSPDAFEHAHEWLPTLFAAVVYLALITMIAQIYCRRVMGLGPVTAVFSAMPGGLSEMVILGEERNPDVRTLTLIHANTDR